MTAQCCGSSGQRKGKRGLARSAIGDRLAAVVERKRWRKPVRRAAFIFVVLITNLSLLITQTYAYTEIERRIHEPVRVLLGATMWDYAAGAVSKAAANALSGLGKAALGLFSAPRGRAPALSPAGRPHPWQAAAPAAPFSVVNMATANLFTEVPIVSWQPLGRPIAFSLFHNTLGAERGQSRILLPKWTHSYSRYIYCGVTSTSYTLYNDEGDSLVFTAKPGEPDTFLPPPGFHMVLKRYTSSGYAELIYKNQDKDRFELRSGHLTHMFDASGNAVKLTYEPDPFAGGQRLAKITDASENSLCLTYDASTGRLIQVTAPPIGPSDSSIERKFDIACMFLFNSKVLKVSTARRNAQGQPLFWAEFEVQGTGVKSDLIRIFDYSTGFDEETGDPLPGAVSLITYQTNSWINTVTLAQGLPEEQTRRFTFSLPSFREPLAVQRGEEDPAHRDVDLGGGGFEPAPAPPGVQATAIALATVQGSRTTPGPDVITYYFDGSSRLERVEDPMGRTVSQVVWDSGNNPRTVTNVYGGAMQLVFDDRGNILSMRPPVGGEWEFHYDTLNNQTYIKDPMGYETNLEYLDPNNPTRPTRIDGPGVSDLTLQWGQGEDENHGFAYDRGKLLRTEGPNKVEQGFSYWSPSVPTRDPNDPNNP